MVNNCLYLGINNICVINEYIKTTGVNEYNICINFKKCNKFEVNK